jgi:hypothetical protein
MALPFSFAADAGEIPIDVSSVVNEPWTFSGPDGAGIINGSTFPSGSQNFGGVPFMIPAGPNNYWNGAAAADFGAGTVHVTVPIGLAGVTSVFTLINTFWGEPGPDAYLSITFKWRNGATRAEQLVGDVNVRDYNNDGNTNSINNTTTVQVWDNGLGQRLDRQEYLIPLDLVNEVLESVTLTDTGNQGEGNSRGVFSALTVSTCQAYVAIGVDITTGPVIYNANTGRYVQDVLLKNVSATEALKGPLYLVLENLTSGIGVTNSSGTTSCYSPGSPYVVIVPEGSSLPPNITAAIRLVFTDPSAAMISYSPLAVTSLGATP